MTAVPPAPPRSFAALVTRTARVRHAAAAVAVVLAMGGVPGASLRAVVRDPAPPLPTDLPGRDGALDVTVRAAPASAAPGAEGAAVGGAHVRVLSILDGRAYLADARDTDAGGRAHLTRLPRGEAWIVADARGCARGSSHLIVEGGARSLAIALGPEHAIDAVVRDDLGAPMAGASIEAIAPGEPLPIGARTGVDGRAHVGRLAAGPWRIVARVAGYEEATARAARDDETVVLVLRKRGAIVARVVGVDDAPVAGAQVAVAGAALWPPRVATTDAAGDVRVGGLDAGSYALRATRADAVSPVEFDVTVARGDEKRIVLHLAAGRFVGVRVTDGDAAYAPPIAAARVTLAEGGLSPFPLEATTDPKGRARLGPIGPGGATLGARADGFMPRGAIAIADPAPAETVVTLVRSGVLTGRVVDARGEPVAGATIEVAGTDLAGGPVFDDPRRARFQSAQFDALLGGPAPMAPAGELGVVPGPVPPVPIGLGVFGGASGSPSRVASGAPLDADPWVTRSDGTFRASPASPGRIRAVVHHPQYVEAESAIVTLSPGGEAHVEVILHEGGTLEGRVVDAHDRPVEGARVIVSAVRGMLERTTRTASDGTFAFVALPDAVVVTASAGGAGDEGTEGTAMRTVLTVAEGGRQEVTLTLPDPREALPVTVVDDRGRGVGAAQISASSLASDAPLRTTAFSDTHGDASLRGGRGVPLRVEIRAPAYAPRVVTTLGTEDALRVELTPAESATGEVVAARGRDPIAGASVALYTDLGVRRARTDGKGAFALGELAPGAARLSVRAPGFAPITRSLTLPESGGRRAFTAPRIELAAEGTVEGDVVDADGAPVPGARVAEGHVPTWLLVGQSPETVAVADAGGHFTLRELAEGTTALEAYAPGVGRARAEDVRVLSGRTTREVRLVVTPASTGDDARAGDLDASGSVAVTLGETGAPVEVVVVSVAEASEAERAGLVPGDVIVSVDGAPVPGMRQARARLSGPLSDDVVVAVRRADREIKLRVAREAVRR